MNDIKENIIKMEKMISSINESKVDSSESKKNQRLLTLKREREKLDRGREEERAAIVVEKKLIIGNAVVGCFGEDIVFEDSFLEQLLKVVKNNKEKIIESVRGEKE